MDEIALFMRDAPKPILGHCQAGSDRSGLAAALCYELVVVGVDPEIAGRQLSIRFGHSPWFGKRTRRMDDAFDAFVANRYRPASADATAAGFKEARSWRS